MKTRKNIFKKSFIVLVSSLMLSGFFSFGIVNIQAAGFTNPFNGPSLDSSEPTTGSKPAPAPAVPIGNTTGANTQTNTVNTNTPPSSNSSVSGKGETGIINPLGDKSIPQIIDEVLTFITKVGAVVAILAFIWVGFLFVKASGNDAKLKEAKSIFFWTVIGVAILLGAKLLADLVAQTIISL